MCSIGIWVMWKPIYDDLCKNGYLTDFSEPLNRPSRVWKWPKFDPICQQGVDILHFEGPGLLEDHLELLKLTKNEFQKISEQTKAISRQVGGQFTTSITSFDMFRRLTARNRFFFALLSPITFPLCLSPERLGKSVFSVWWSHITYMVILTKHTISSEELETAKEEAKRCWSVLVKDSSSGFNPNTPNTHLLLHQFGNIPNFGVPRGYWCFKLEAMIDDLKFLELRNTNWGILPHHFA